MTNVNQVWDGQTWQAENIVDPYAEVKFPASTNLRPSANMPVGTAPGAGQIEIGDIWHQSDGLYYRNEAGASVGPLGAPPTIDESNLVHKTLTETITGDKTFSGTTTLASTTSIGTVSGTEIGYLDGVASAIQTQLNAKAADSAVVHIAGTETITGAKTFSSDVTVNGNFAVNGTTTTFNSATVTVDDPIFTLGGDTAPTVDDNKDRGIEFRYHNGTAAKVGFFGFDDSTGKFTFIPDATNTSEVFSGTKGSIDAYFSGSDINTGTVAAAYIDSAIARDNAVVHLAGTETISGAKTFSNELRVSSAAGDSPAIRLSSGDGYRLVFQAKAAAAEATINMQDNQPLAFQFNGTEKLRITSSAVITLANAQSTMLPFAYGSRFGYSTGYRALVLGDTGTATKVTIALGVDPLSITDASNWSGDGREILLRNSAQFMMPNAGGTAFIKPLTFGSAGEATFSSSVNANSIVSTGTISASGLAGSLLSSATPLAGTLAGSAGTSAIPSRQDHVHATPAVLVTQAAGPTGATAGGWYTIAINAGSRASAKFVLMDQTSGLHQTVHFYASHHYGSGNDITVLHNDYHSSGGTVQQIRIKEGGVYDGAALQVYIDNSATSLVVYIYENPQSAGWVVKNFIADASDPGGLTNYSLLTNVAISVNLDSGTSIFGDWVSMPKLYMPGSSSGAATIMPPAAAGTPTLTLPTSSGTLALDAALVHLAGAETITGDKRFSTSVIISASALTPSGVLDLGPATNGRAISWGGTAGNYANIWTAYSSGALVLAGGLRGTTSTSDAYVSSTSGASARAAVRINSFGSNGIQFFTDVSSTVADGSSITPTERFRIESGGDGVFSGNFGIGTTPITTLHVSGNGSEYTQDRYSSDTTGANLILRKARGTQSVPSAVLANDFLGAMRARGYGTSAFGTENVGLIGIAAAENFTNSAQGTYITFGTTPTGSTTRTERMRITAAGAVEANDLRSVAVLMDVF